MCYIKELLNREILNPHYHYFNEITATKYENGKKNIEKNEKQILNINYKCVKKYKRDP